MLLLVRSGEGLLAKKKRRRLRARAPQARQPDAIRIRYFGLLRALLRRMQEILQEELLDDLSILLRIAQEEAGTRKDGLRLDAGGSKRIQEKIAQAAKRFAEEASPARLERLATQIGTATSEFQRNELNKQLRSTLGVELSGIEPGAAARLEAFTAENVGLIKSIPATYFDQVEKRVLRAVSDGTRHEDLAKDLQERFGVAESSAKLVARDQVGKYYGALNQVRQESVGINGYVWRTSQDNRVREEHEEREGESFSWDDPPADGHPGQPINCRCYAEPDIEALLREIG